MMAGQLEKTILDSLASVRNGDVLLIVPPFAHVNRPSLGVHLLQACAKEAGFRVSVWYGNLALAALFGIEHYNVICNAPFNLFIGERIFSASAYGLHPFGRDGVDFLGRHALPDSEGKAAADLPATTLERVGLKASVLKKLETTARNWTDAVAAAVAARPFNIVGCSTMFDQTAASFALLNRIKRTRGPNVLTIIGGPNCEGEMADGIASLSSEVDFIFSGESETTFIQFLQGQRRAEPRLPRVVHGQPCRNLDALPIPTFREYFQQLEHHFPAGAERPAEIALICESSRGCWWGEKHHCTFCGLNGEGMSHRKKSPGKMIGELKQLLEEYPCQRVRMTDNIMPFSYFKDLLPELSKFASQQPSLKIFYEQKANLSLTQVLALMAAGITHIQPGIEALSTSLLKRMDKGVTASQNIALLRYARAVDLTLSWNLLWGFPGDEVREYEETLALLPLLHHLPPPTQVAHLSIDRFSPYFDRPEAHGLTKMAPWPGFEMILPPGVDPRKVAYHFGAEYECASRSNPELMREIQEQVRQWQRSWNRYVSLWSVRISQRPRLEVIRGGDEQFVLLDTRELPGTESYSPITRSQAAAALVPTRADPDPELEWALGRKVGVVVDSRYYVPLATAGPDILQEFENQMVRTFPWSA